MPVKMLTKYSWSTIVWLVFISLSIHIPFLNKPLHIDDFAFLKFSKLLQWNPVLADIQDSFYMGNVFPDVIPYESTHPIFIPYLLKALTFIFQHNFIFFHLFFSVFTFLTLFGVLLICTTLFQDVRHRFWILVFWVTTPAYLVNSHNLMTDVPALGMGLFGIGLYLSWIDNRAQMPLILSVLFITLSIFCAYQYIIFIVPLVAYQLAVNPKELKKILPLVIPPLILFSWLVIIYQLYEIFPLFRSKIEGVDIADHVRMGWGWKAWKDKILFNFATIGFTCLPFLPIYILQKKKRGILFRNFLLVSIPLVLYVFFFTSFTSGQKAQYVVYLASGTSFTLYFYVSLLRLISNNNHRPSALFLLSWHFLFLVATTLFFPFASVRYALPVLIPLIIFLFIDISPFIYSQVKTFFLWGMLCFSAVLGFLCAKVDYDHAVSYRQFADEVKNINMKQQNSFKFWYIGEWGMRYYMDNVGSHYLLAQNYHLSTGDMVVVPKVSQLWNPSPLLIPRLKGYATRNFSSRVPLRLFDRDSQAGFYCHFWGALPVDLLSRGPVESFNIYKVF